MSFGLALANLTLTSRQRPTSVLLASAPGEGEALDPFPAMMACCLASSTHRNGQFLIHARQSWTSSALTCRQGPGSV